MHYFGVEEAGAITLWLMAFAVTLAPGFAAQLPNQLIVAKKNEVLVHVGYVDVCAAPASNKIARSSNVAHAGTMQKERLSVSEAVLR